MKSSIRMLRNPKMIESRATWFVTVIFIIFFVSHIFLLPNAAAYLEREKMVNCPLCGEKVKIFETLSMTVSGSYRDFQRRINGPYYFHLFAHCPTCHFSGYASDFSRTVSEDIKRKVLIELKSIPVGPFHIEKFEFAAKISSWEKKGYAEIGKIYLFGSYHLKYMTDLRDKKFVDLRKRYQALAGEYFIKALETNEIKERERGAISYLIGELYRRRGEFEKALVWYDRALQEENSEDFKGIIEEQKEMARNRNAGNDI